MIDDSMHALPAQVLGLTAAAQRAMPQPGDLEAEDLHPCPVAGHGEVACVPADHRAQVLSLLGNRVYAGKNGNGPESSGHGWLYRGRGLIQTTGLANYRAAARTTGAPLVERPDLLLAPDHAAMAAAGYWERANCNRLADAGNVDAITRAINGAAMAGAAHRRDLSNDAMVAFA